MRTTKQSKASKFQRGSGAYDCTCCGRKTRSTGRGDNELVLLCAECFDASGIENMIQDGNATDADRAELERLIAQITSLGGTYPRDTTTPATQENNMTKATRKTAKKTVAPVVAPAVETNQAAAPVVTAAPIPAPLAIYPRLVVKDSTRYGVAYREVDGIISVLNIEEGFYDVREVMVDAFKHEYVDVADLPFVSRVPATLERFIGHMTTTTLSFTQAAVDALTEIQIMQSSAIINTAGVILDKTAPGALVLTFGAANNLERLNAFLSDKARGAFVSSVLKLAKPLAKLSKDDARVAEAVKALVGDAKAAAAAETKNKVAAKAASNKATTKATGPKKISLKQMVNDLLVAGKSGDLAYFVKETGGTDVSVRTALSDLKNAKYAINGNALPIVKSEEGVYSLSKGGTVVAKASAKKAAAAPVKAEKAVKAAPAKQASAAPAAAPAKAAKKAPAKKAAKA